MKCPTCPDVTLVMADRAGIEIDYCPTCRGVWLDRGELDKIIERSASAAPSVATVPAPPAVATAPRNSKYHEPQHSKYHEPPYKKKKSSMLGDLFDF